MWLIAVLIAWILASSHSAMSASQPTFAEAVAANPQINPTWSANADLTYGDDVVVILTPAGSTNVFVAEAGTGDLTGGSEPNWASAPSPGDTVSDNDYEWVNVGPQSSFPPTPTTWSPTTDYSAADTSVVLVWPTVPNGQVYISYVGYFGSSDSFEPTFACALGHYVPDGDGYWQSLGPELTTEPTQKLVVLGVNDYQFGAAVWLGIDASTGAQIVQANKRQFGDPPDTDQVQHTFPTTRNHPDGDVWYSALRGTNAKVQQFDRLMQPTANFYPPSGSNNHTIDSLSIDAAGFIYYVYKDNGDLSFHVVKLNKDLTLVTDYTLTRPADFGTNTNSHISADGTALYYLNAAGVGALVLASNTFSNLITTGPASLSGGDILVKADGNIVFVVVSGTTSITEYSSAGSVLTTNTVSGIGNVSVLDPDQLHVWVADDNTPNQFVGKYLVSSGALIESVPYTTLDANLAPSDLVVLGPVASSGPGRAWPVWLQDGTFLVVENPYGDWFAGGLYLTPGPYQADSQIVRYDLAGRELQRFTYPSGLGQKGLAGIAASLFSQACEDDGQGRLYVAFYYDDDHMAFLAFDLKTGKQVGDIMPQAISDTAVDLAAGFVHLQNQGPSSDGSFEETDLENPPEDNVTEDDVPGDCPPAGPGGSSFDGAPDGPRFVAPGGFPATYVPPTGEGAVATAVDPVDTQSLDALTKPQVSADLKVCDGTTYRLAKTSLPRLGLAPMDARVLRFADVPYPMADRFGSLPAQTWSVTLADEDGLFRGLLATGVNRFYKRWTVDVFIEDDSARLAGIDRQRLYRGRCVSVRTEDDQTVALVFSDEYSRHDSPYSLDRELPHLLIGDIFGSGASSADLGAVPTPPDDQITGHAATIMLGECSDEYRAAENVTPIGVCQLHDLGDVLLGSEVWRAFFVCLYASYRVPALFGSNLDPTCPASVRLDPALYNGDQTPQFLVPGYAPWDAYFANKYVEVQRGGVTYWVTLIFGRGPILQQHLDNVVPLSANVDGVEDVGDGSGALIDDISRQVQWLIDHPLLRKTTSGVWGAAATFPDGIAKVRTSDFEAIRLIHNARLSTRFRGSIIIDSTRAGRDWLADICVSAGIRLTLNQHGQVGGVAFDTRTALTALRTFTDLLHIRDGSFKITSEISGEVENSLDVQAGPEPSSGRFTVGTFPILAGDSIENWGDVYPAQPITFVALRRLDVAQAVAGERLIQTQDGVTRGTFGVDLAGGAVRAAELLRLTHLAGIGPLGWRKRVVMATNRTLIIEDAVSPGDGWQTRVEFEDVHPILVMPGSDDEDTPTSRFGFSPLGSEAGNTATILGSEAAGTAPRLG